MDVLVRLDKYTAACWQLFSAVAIIACASCAEPAPDPSATERLGLRCVDDDGARSVLVVGAAPAPIPVFGSDGREHVVYELPVTNATSLEMTVTELEVSAGGEVVRTFSSDEVAAILEPLGTRSATGTLAPSVTANLFVALDFSVGEVPNELEHRITVTADAFPAPLEQTGCTMTVDHETAVPVLGSPLAPGERYAAADGCCNAVRHTRAPIVIDGRIYFAQRFAIDWEQIDADGRFVNGDPSNPEDYVIYGAEIVAAAGGEVVHVIDGLPDQVPGELPTGVTFEQADGNSVVIDHGDGTFALYAHMKAGSPAVAVGDRVRRGDPLGLVGNSGNSSAPHLHFHLMDGPSPLASNGLPYVIDAFDVTATWASTEIFDEVENTTEPLPTEPTSGEPARTDAMPLDRSLVTFR